MYKKYIISSHRNGIFFSLNRDIRWGGGDINGDTYSGVKLKFANQHIWTWFNGYCFLYRHQENTFYMKIVI